MHNYSDTSLSLDIEFLLHPDRTSYVCPFSVFTKTCVPVGSIQISDIPDWQELIGNQIHCNLIITWPLKYEFGYSTSISSISYDVTRNANELIMWVFQMLPEGSQVHGYDFSTPEDDIGVERLKQESEIIRKK